MQSRKKFIFNKLSNKGFTLIEIMIAIVVVAILVSVALPNYQNSVRKAKRSAAKTALFDVASRQESYRMDNKEYTSTLSDLNFLDNFSVDSDNKILTTDTGIYNITATVSELVVDDGNGNVQYTLTATAINAQDKDTKCLTFTLTHTGVKTSLPDTNCW